MFLENFSLSTGWTERPTSRKGEFCHMRSFHGTVIAQPLYPVLMLCCFGSICNILTFTFDMKLSIVYAFGLKHDKKSKRDFRRLVNLI